MKKLLLLVGVAVVAAAMYVAASPASRPSAYASQKEVVALQKKVAALNKSLKTVRTAANAAVGFIGTCFLTISGKNASETTFPVSQFGTAGDGFLYGSPNAGGAAPVARSALDYDPSQAARAHLQMVNVVCGTGTPLSHRAVRSGSSRLLRWAEGTR